MLYFFRRSIGLLITVIAVCPGSSSLADSAEAVGPPVGPPWVHKFVNAQREALKRRVPLVLFFVNPEDGEVGRSDRIRSGYPLAEYALHLSDSSLRSLDDSAVWFYQSVDKADNSPSGRQGRRLQVRMEVATFPLWSQGAQVFRSGLFVADPATLDPAYFVTPQQASASVPQHQKFADSLKTVLNAVVLQQEKQKGTPASLVAVFQTADQRAEKLELMPTRESAIRALSEQDWFLRYRAFQVLARNHRKVLVDKAHLLLEVVAANGAVPVGPATGRYRNERFITRVFMELANSGDSRSAKILSEVLCEQLRLLDNPQQVKLLEACAVSPAPQMLDDLQKLVREGDVRNMRTRAAIDAVVAVADEFPDSRTNAARILRQSFPPVPDRNDPIELELTIEVARKLHAGLKRITDRNVPFPEDYNAETRSQLISAW